MLPEVYQQFIQSIGKEIPAANIVTDPLRTVAYGSDASF
jgi:transposase